MRNLVYILFVVVLIGGWCYGDVYPVEDFSFFTGGEVNNDQEIVMASGDNLMIREPNAILPNAYNDSIVSTEGYWHMGFRFEDDFVGWAKNSLKFLGDGYMRGYYSHFLGLNNRPDEVFLVHDVLGDGIGFYDDSSGSWILGDDDVFYAYDFEGGIFDASKHLLFGDYGVLGLARADLAYLPEYTGTLDTLTLPSMIIYIRSSNLQTFANLAASWLCVDCAYGDDTPGSDNNWLNGADNDHDSDVDFDDLIDVILTWLAPEFS